MSDVTVSSNCMSVFWRQHEAKLSRSLTPKTGDNEKAADLLQELLLHARTYSDSFYKMENPRAQLYRVVRNLLIDEYHTTREFVGLEDDAPLTGASPDTISMLDICLPETLQTLPEGERWSIEESDPSRHPQQPLASELGITLTAFKSRLLRARKHLKETMTEPCQIEADDMSPICRHEKMN